MWLNEIDNGTFILCVYSGAFFFVPWHDVDQDNNRWYEFHHEMLKTKFEVRKNGN